MPKSAHLDTSHIQLFPLGDSALVVQFGEVIDVSIHEQVRAFAEYVEVHPFYGFVEQVPAYTTVTVYYNPWLSSLKGKVNPYETVVVWVQEALAKMTSASKKTGKVVKEIPVCYSSEFGPDLKFVAENSGLSEAEVIALHTAPEYLVYMMGFAPGFPYLGGLNLSLATPRKATPRPTIPAGSVGIAGEQTGVYPMQTPGGWQLIGRTPLALFKVHRETPSLLQMGDTVKFVPIRPEEFYQLQTEHHGS
ncbi:5-oxoprolinase subunit PxpB [Nibribacter ruber]|uniref:5-oxoprolinase subunit PxpB n=1 Tax=Nibribacter ruber TaxID=2698458 RepID=A0A6P1NUC6_9BACT|nr:5-oxoprolinase subunit PxpB [Nibribacter ruber]QHL85924.1 5-oxoprolinase subunit PxpB [Nibribacter ruber]